MKKYLSIKGRLFVTSIFTLYTLSLIIWDYTHKGVPVHYLFESNDVPGFSNWLGIIIVPVVSWIILKRVSKRENYLNESFPKFVILRFLLAAVFGIIVTLFFFSEVSEVVSYLMIVLLITSFFFPLYRGEFFLGYVMSTLFAFGAFIPTLGAIILTCILFLFNKIGRTIATVLQPKESI